MAIDLKDYAAYIDAKVTDAIQAIITKITKDHNVPTEQERIDIVYNIQDYLARKWLEEKDNRFVCTLLAQVEAFVEECLKEPCSADGGVMRFLLTEEAAKAEMILKSKHFETERVFERVEYWKPGKRYLNMLEEGV